MSEQPPKNTEIRMGYSINRIEPNEVTFTKDGKDYIYIHQLPPGSSGTNLEEILDQEKIKVMNSESDYLTIISKSANNTPDDFTESQELEKWAMEILIQRLKKLKK